MAIKKDQSSDVQRRYYPADSEPTGNILNDVAIRGIRAVFQKSVKGVLKDGSLGALLDELGYDLIKRPKQKPKQKPSGKPAVPRKTSKAKASTSKTRTQRTKAQ